MQEEKGDKPAYLIDAASQIDPQWFDGCETVLVTAGASAPEEVVEECLAFLMDRYGAHVEPHTIREEFAQFPLPIELRAHGRVSWTRELCRLFGLGWHWQLAASVFCGPQCFLGLWGPLRGATSERAPACNPGPPSPYGKLRGCEKTCRLYLAFRPCRMCSVDRTDRACGTLRDPSVSSYARASTDIP